MYRKYRIVESIASSVSQYESYRDQVYRYTPNEYSHVVQNTNMMWWKIDFKILHFECG